MMTPRIEIDLSAVRHNAATLMEMCARDSIGIAGVTKATAGDVRVAKAMIGAGIREIADSRIENLRTMKDLDVSRLLLRPPEPSRAQEVVEVSGSSLNSELATIRELGRCSLERGEEHGIVLMIDMGDRREGVMPEDASSACQDVLDTEGVFLRGIGTNLACFAGVIPTPEKMADLSSMADRIEEDTGTRLEMISGGNSANVPMLVRGQDHGRVNHLRLGESILLGLETVERRAVPGLRTDAFVLAGEMIEVKEKPSTPDGEIGQDAFGGVPSFQSEGEVLKGLVDLGRQDVDPMDLRPLGDMEVLGGSSDHTILRLGSTMDVGDEVRFLPGYGSLLRAMTSPYVRKVYI